MRSFVGKTNVITQAFLVAALVCVPFMAQGQVSVSMTDVLSGVAVGGSVHVKVTVDDATNLESARVKLSWDTDVFEFQQGSLDMLDALAGCTTPVVNSSVPGELVLSMACFTNTVTTAGEQTLVSFYLNVKDNAPCDQAHTIQLDGSLTRLNDGQLSSTVADGTVQVACTPEPPQCVDQDINGDGTIDKADLLSFIECWYYTRSVWYSESNL